MIYDIPDKNVAYIAKARELYKNRDKCEGAKMYS